MPVLMNKALAKPAVKAAPVAQVRKEEEREARRKGVPPRFSPSLSLLRLRDQAPASTTRRIREVLVIALAPDEPSGEDEGKERRMGESVRERDTPPSLSLSRSLLTRPLPGRRRQGARAEIAASRGCIVAPAMS